MQLKTDFSEDEGWKIRLFHSHFLGPDRSKREAELMEQIGKRSTKETRNKTIVIGTQVLEQSLDLDFDLMITELCPMDLLIQRLGRLHRHKRERPDGLKDAHCAVIEIADPNQDRNFKNSIAIYGEYLLRYTKSLLPNIINIPTDISPLVQKTYAKDTPSKELQSQYDVYYNNINILEREGEAFRIKGPRKRKNPMWDLITDVVGPLYNEQSESDAEASVRGASDSIEVLLFGMDGNGNAVILSGENEKKLIPMDIVPQSEQGRTLAAQRVHLPFFFSVGQLQKKTIDELEVVTSKFVPMWQQSSWIRGRLVFFLNSDGFADLCGYRLRYDHEMGLYYNKNERGG